MTDHLLRVDRDDGTPLSDQLVDQIRLMAASGVLSPGDRLPTVRQLAVDLGINRNTAAKAYGLSREDGVIVTRSGGGSSVAEGPRRLAAREKRERYGGPSNAWPAKRASLASSRPPSSRNCGARFAIERRDDSLLAK